MATEARFLIRIAQACSVREVIDAFAIPGLREIRARNNRANAAVPATPWVPAAKFLARYSVRLARESASERRNVPLALWAHVRL